MDLIPKSRITSFILTLLFGPLGLFYSSIAGAIALIIVAVVSASTVVGPIVCWLLAIGIGDHCTYKHNQNIEAIKEMSAK